MYAIARTLATFLHDYTYIRALTFEIPELLVYIAIGFLFRLRNFEPFETIELGNFSNIFCVLLREGNVFSRLCLCLSCLSTEGGPM